MRITVNDEQREVPEGMTVGALMIELGLGSAVCAAEVNKRLVPRSQRDERALEDGDAVELVTLVGGG